MPGWTPCKSNLNQLQQSTGTANAMLGQNIPNPFTHCTSIFYVLPQKFTHAQIIITDKIGNTIKKIDISGNGKGILTIDASTFGNGGYSYSLYVDGKLID